MKISNNKDFNTLVSHLCSFLCDNGTPVKTARGQELISRAFGYKSANGLRGDMPIELRVTETVESRLHDLLKSRHGIDSVDTQMLLRTLEKGFISLSTSEGLDKDCYPSWLPENTNYWYLTANGWEPWSRLDFTKLRVELGIYKVVVSFSSVPLSVGEMPFVCFARTIWSADVARIEFEDEARRLERKYGEMPESYRMYAGG